MSTKDSFIYLYRFGICTYCESLVGGCIIGIHCICFHRRKGFIGEKQVYRLVGKLK